MHYYTTRQPNTGVTGVTVLRLGTVVDSRRGC